MSDRAPARVVAVGALLALAFTGCGASTPKPPPVAGRGGPFRWLAQGRAPANWPPTGVVAGGSLPQPPGWQPIRGDRGSTSFVQRRAGTIVGYLNATPRSGDETIANWARFRVAHNAQEGDRDIAALAEATGVGVGSARVSCVTDEYLTSLSRYREIACLIAARRASTVVLGAAPPRDWSRQRPIIERAIAGFLAG